MPLIPVSVLFGVLMPLRTVSRGRVPRHRRAASQNVFLVSRTSQVFRVETRSVWTTFSTRAADIFVVADMIHQFLWTQFSHPKLKGNPVYSFKSPSRLTQPDPPVPLAILGSFVDPTA